MSKYRYRKAFIFILINVCLHTYAQGISIVNKQAVASRLLLLNDLQELHFPCDDKKDFYTKFLRNHPSNFSINSMGLQELDVAHNSSFTMISIPENIFLDEQSTFCSCITSCCLSCFAKCSCCPETPIQEKSFLLQYCTISIGQKNSNKKSSSIVAVVELIDHDGYVCLNTQAMRDNNISCTIGTVFINTTAFESSRNTNNTTERNLAVYVNNELYVSNLHTSTLSTSKDGASNELSLRVNQESYTPRPHATDASISVQLYTHNTTNSTNIPTDTIDSDGLNVKTDLPVSSRDSNSWKKRIPLSTRL